MRRLRLELRWLFSYKNKVMNMLEKYDEFSQKKKQIEHQKAQFKKKIAGLNKQKLELKKRQIQTQMNKFVAGASSY
jgi:phage shock protein A